MKLVGESRERAQFSISCLPQGARLEGQQLIRRFSYHDDKRGHRKASAKTQEHFMKCRLVSMSTPFWVQLLAVFTTRV